MTRDRRDDRGLHAHRRRRLRCRHLRSERRDGELRPTPDVGTAKPVTGLGFALAGAAAADYTITAVNPSSARHHAGPLTNRRGHRLQGLRRDDQSTATRRSAASRAAPTR